MSFGNSNNLPNMSKEELLEVSKEIAKLLVIN